MIQAFKENPILLLFIVAAIGYWVGQFRFRGSSLGVAAVLFVGLGFGALDPDLHIPEVLIFLGLTIFVYTIGLQTGPGFFQNLRRRGSKDILFIFAMLLLSAAMTVGLHFVFDFDASITAGLFAGVSTNTPALAGLLDLISSTGADESISRNAVVGYSLTYPMGVIGVMIAINLMYRWLGIDYRQEARALRSQYPVSNDVEAISLKVGEQVESGRTIRDWMRSNKWKVVFGRMERNGQTILPNWDTEVKSGDLIRVIGNDDQIEQVVEVLGKQVDDLFPIDGTAYEVKRIFVSNPKVAGQKLAALNIDERYSAVVTRISRGDIDLLANGDTILELGDRVLFVARKEDIPGLSKLFGDSFEALSHINLLSFGLGMAIGLLLGMVTFQFPGGFGFRLGFAGGPLIIAILLGALRRTGPIVWTLPYTANLTLRQIGLILLLAGIGVNSGHTFLATLMEGRGGFIFLSGTLISIVTTIITLWVGYKLMKLPFSILTGMVSNQPAILDFAMNKSDNKLPTIGFTTMLPVALITKILVVQLMYVFLS